MPRRERAPRTRSVVASAKNWTIKKSDDKVADSKARQGESWHYAAWDFFDTVPEYQKACTIVGALMSRAKLSVYENGEPTTNPVALAALEELYGGPEGQVEMLRQFGIHFSVAGGGWLQGPGNPEDVRNPDKWSVAASCEVSKTGGDWKVNGKLLKGQPIMVEIWKPHPRDRRKYQSPTRPILGVLSELLQLTKRVAAQIDSRLTGAGLLLVPSETSFPSVPVRQLNPGDPASSTDSIQAGDAQGLADLLAFMAEQAIQNPESSAAMIPVIGEVPGEYIGQIKHINFWSELDRAAPKLREENIRRIGNGMEVPADVLLGGEGSNHWNMWLADENNTKIHSEPLLRILTAGLTSGYLWPALEGEEGIEDEHAFTIHADTSQMRLRPNRSKEALELNDRLILSDLATARENGFEESDLMDEEGRIRALTRKVAGGSTTPEIVEAALRAAGLDLEVMITDKRAPAQARPTPSLVEHPTRSIPERQAASVDHAGLVFAAEQMVDRALQRAGNRIKTKYGIANPPVKANRLYQVAAVDRGSLDDLLADAWESVHLGDYGVDSTSLARALDLYTRSIIISRREPTRASLSAALKLLLRQDAA